MQSLSKLVKWLKIAQKLAYENEFKAFQLFKNIVCCLRFNASFRYSENWHKKEVGLLLPKFI